MATTRLDNRPKLTGTVKTALAGLRTRIRLYVWFEGLACAMAWLGAAFWVSLAADWFFEPSVSVRRVILAMVGMGVVGIVVRLIGRRAFVRLSDANMATLLERRFAVLDDALLTAVMLTDRESTPVKPRDECSATLLEQTCSQAARRIGELRLGDVFNPVPLRRSLVAAILLGSSIGLFAGQCSDAFRVWTERNILLGEGLWPRSTRLSVEGFENRVAKVARGSDFTLIARADMQKEVVPKVVEVRYRAEGGARNRATMSRLGAARKGSDPFQEYSYTFQGVLAPIRFDVVGGDDRVSGLRIEVVDSPTISELLLDCQFPAYMGRSPRTLPHVGAMQLPRGTRITARATANKTLTRVQIDSLAGEEALSQTVLPRGKTPPDWHDFQHTLPSLDQDVTLVFTLSDTDGITAREPVRLPLVAIEDQPPQLTVRLGGIGPAVTPGASLPAKGQITDDYGVDKLRFVYTVDQQEPARRPIGLPTGDTTDVPLEAALDISDLKLAAGQKLLLRIEAADRYDLEEGPNVGTSERWVLDIVTPEQLRVMLEARELVLRQRFERIVEEVVESRDLLMQIEFETKQPAEVEPPPAETPASTIEPGDKPRVARSRETPEELSPESLLDHRLLRVQQVVQNGRKSTHEILGIAAAFDDIRLQLINNRIDTEPFKIRLKDQIADPLRQIAETRFPELERQLGRVREHAADAQLGPQQRDLARLEIDAILLEMRRVLGSMIELEDFNEAVELLREIIRLQKELDEQTRQRHKDTLRQLMEGL